MVEPRKHSHQQSARSFFTLRSLMVAIATASLISASIAPSLGASNTITNAILGRPTNNSVAVSIMASEKTRAYIEYGYSKTKYSNKSATLTIEPGTPALIELRNLKSNSKIYYRLRYNSGLAKSFESGKQNIFTTARKENSTFTFTVQGDSHPERAGKMFNAELYLTMLANIAKQQPDFHILIGDDFSIDPIISKGLANQANVEKIYRTHRDWLGGIAGSIPLFLINGNHEQAASYLLDGTITNPAVLAGNARLKYYPLPAPDSFYTGNSSEIPGIGLPRDYYAWTWGDALFVTLDPYWHSKNPVDNVAGINNADDQGGGNKKAAASRTGKSKDMWAIGIGDEQYAWLKKTLESSSAKYKFVFAHHVMGTGRGGIELSYDYEWGGRDPKGISNFAKERPNWELPIHDLMVKNKVSIFFQGHDHIFVTQERDGLIYQTLPNPADDTFTYFNDAAYKTGTKAPNSGHVRVTVSPEKALVEYFLVARPKDTARQNMQIAHSYSVTPKE